jgi:HAD superfamily hydrolase (TIGR01450 family)
VSADSIHLERLRQTHCFLLDMDGTFYLGDRLLPGALDFIDTITHHGQDFIFLTNNSSKSSRQYAEKITRLGLSIPEEKVFTSGEATALYLKMQTKHHKLFLVGTPELEAEFTRHGFSLVQEGPEAVVMGFDTAFTYEKLWRLCNHVRAGLPYFATHPDFNCPIVGGVMPDIGATIAFVKASTGRVPDLVVGKPNRMIVEMLARKLALPIERLAMIGDRLYTDIALGQTAGVTTVLVLSGETRPEDLQGSPYQPDYVFADLGALARALRKIP